MRRTSGDGTDPSLLLSRDFRYSADRAVEVVEGATHVIVVTGVSTMLALGIVLNIIGLGFFCWVLLTLAIYALPFFVGMTAGLYAHGAGAGPFGAIVLGLLAAAFTLVIGQTIFSLVRTPILRIAVALMSAVPAALAGYYATFGLSGLTITSVSLAVGLRRDRAVVIGVTACAACSIPARRIGRARKTGNVVGPTTPRPDETSSTPSRTPWVLIGARPKLGA
jgi:hypothetical protein